MTAPAPKPVAARQPYIPTQSEWPETFETLCGHCRHMLDCDVIEAMIECKDGEPWPAGGWVTDPGAGVTCLSYATKDRQKLSRPVLKRHIQNACEMCDGCAARKGSEASTSLHTQRDFKASVKDRTLFTCHDPKNQGAPCGGWALAMKHGRPTR